MKIRCFIFLIVIVLGFFPIITLVGLNLPRTMKRLEYAAELEIQARSHVDFTKLNARVKCLKKSLIRTATLPSTYAALHNPSMGGTLAGVLNRWFEDDAQVKGFMFLNAEGDELLSLHRRDGLFQLSNFSENHREHSFFKHSLAITKNKVLARLVDHKSDPFHRTPKNDYELIMSTPVIEEGLGTTGIMLLRIDMSEFLKNFLDSIWITEDGSYLHGCIVHDELGIETSYNSDTACNLFAEFSVRQNKKEGEPLIITDEKEEKIAWMPLVFNEDDRTVMWVGSLVDESAIKQWRSNLLLNVLVISCIMALLVFLSANWIASKIEHIQKDLLVGLDDILNKEKRVEFHWGGPQEIKNLALDLTALSKRYSDTCEARLDAEILLRESEDKFRSLTGSALDAIILMDHEGNITYWNEAATTILGFTAEEALGNPIHTLIHPRREGDDSTHAPMGQVQTGASIAQSVELIAKNKGGEDVLLELSLSSTTIKGRWHAIWIVRDISERKRSEEEARRQQLQLQHADKMISLGLLVSGVAHEINNPNSIALLNLPILIRSWESVKPILDEFYEENGDFVIAGIEYSKMRSQLPRICQSLEESAARIKQIVVDLKNYARQETTGQQQPEDVKEIVKSAVRLTSNSINKSTNNFTVEYSSEPLMIKGNRQRLTQVVINLIQNSCEALDNTDLSLNIATRCNKEIDAVEVAILDQGAGIEPEDLNQVTDPFFTTKRSIGGTGLGLSVSAGIVKEHNGMMKISSEKGKGTEVILVFPSLQTMETTDKDMV